MQQQDKYKYASIILGIIALVFAYLYFSRPEPSAGDLYQSVSDKVAECSNDISDWNQKYGSQASSTEKQEALNEILENCKDVVGEGQTQLQ